MNDKHIFVTSALGFTKGLTEAEAVMKHLRHFRQKGRRLLYVCVIEVPLPLDAEYSINYYVPEVPGCVKRWEGKINNQGALVNQEVTPLPA